MEGTISWSGYEKLGFGALFLTTFVVGCVAASATCTFGGDPMKFTFKNIQEMADHGGAFECSVSFDVPRAGIFLALASSTVTIGALGLKLQNNSKKFTDLVTLSLLIVPIAVGIGALYAISFNVPFLRVLVTYNTAWRINFSGVVTLVTAVINAAAIYYFSEKSTASFSDTKFSYFLM